MLMAILTLISGLLISGVAIFYSVAGLTSIFSSAPIPIMVMGVSLEIAKLVATVWLKQNWNIAPRLLKAYLIVSVSLLMVITSMGIFGYLSKAHSDQSLVSGDIAANLSTYDLKIQTAKDNIISDKTELRQLDTAVDQTMGRSTDTQGAQRSVSIRRSQQTERLRLQTDIESQQAIITKNTEDSAPIRAQSRKVEAEVGPIKYIAQLIYGPNPSENLLEKAVSWVIILIVIVFDPLAITLLLASQYSFSQALEQRRKPKIVDSFVENLETSWGSVPPEIDLECNGPVDLHVQGDIDAIEAMARGEIPYPASAEEPAPEDETPETTITHTADGMIIEDSAGTQTISAYVQNEEQQESSVWSKIAKSITEQEYLEVSRQKQDDQ